MAGSNPADYLKFGYREVPSGDDRYAIADEFTTLMKYLWANEDPVDFEGEHFQCYGGYVAPKSVRQPRPVLMNAGQSERGFDFACRNVDWMFIAPKHGTIEEYEEYADKAHRLAASYHRKVRLAAMCYAVIEDTDRQAEQTIAWLQDNADIDAFRTYVRAMFGTSVQYEGSLDDDECSLFRFRTRRVHEGVPGYGGLSAHRRPRHGGGEKKTYSPGGHRDGRDWISRPGERIGTHGTRDYPPIETPRDSTLNR